MDAYRNNSSFVAFLFRFNKFINNYYYIHQIIIIIIIYYLTLHPDKKGTIKTFHSFKISWNLTS